MILCTPTVICMLFLWIFSLKPDNALYSPMLVDHTNGRTTCNNTQLGEFITTAKRYDVVTPVSTAVHKIITDMDTKAGAHVVEGIKDLDIVKTEAMAIMKAYADKHPNDHVIAEEARTFTIGKKSLNKLKRHIQRWLIYIALVGMFYILFIHEHEHEEELEALPGHLDQEIL